MIWGWLEKLGEFVAVALVLNILGHMGLYYTSSSLVVLYVRKFFALNTPEFYSIYFFRIFNIILQQQILGVVVIRYKFFFLQIFAKQSAGYKRL